MSVSKFSIAAVKQKNLFFFFYILRFKKCLSSNNLPILITGYLARTCYWPTSHISLSKSTERVDAPCKMLGIPLALLLWWIFCKHADSFITLRKGKGHVIFLFFLFFILFRINLELFNLNIFWYTNWTFLCPSFI